MRDRCSEVYLHFVWATWMRHPLITPEIRSRLHANIAHQCVKLGADVIAIGGTGDHVHVFVEFPSTISIADFVGRLKGASSHFITHVLRTADPFKWQGGYGVFSISKRAIPAVREYVLNQEQRHKEGAVFGALERTPE